MKQEAEKMKVKDVVRAAAEGAEHKFSHCFHFSFF